MATARPQVSSWRHTPAPEVVLWKQDSGKMAAAAKKSVLSSLAVYAEDSEPESDSEAGGTGSERGAGTGEALVGVGWLVRPPSILEPARAAACPSLPPPSAV